VGAFVSGISFLLAIFGCVLLHELGHALAARRYGVRTRDITLLPIGGVARLERMPDKPAQELWVALAGPAVNVGISAILFLWLVLTSSFVPVSELGVVQGSFVDRLLVVNLLLAAFNMIPAFPMDGGRVLRACLAMRWDYARATRTAAALGQALAATLGFVGLFYNPILLLVALFVWLGASQEAGAVGLRWELRRVSVGRVMLTDFRVLEPSDPLQAAADLVLAGSQRDFPVVVDGRPVGMLSRDDLLRGLASSGPQAPVAGAMSREHRSAGVDDDLSEAMTWIQASPAESFPVLRDGRLVGLLTMDNILEYRGIQAAMAKISNDGTGGRPALADRSIA
jgi:Zn-dependent protease/CBS domain-containing protein